jgi:demethylmenaquinone methyltransferase/2-methoxy-6-polyprenyl-1,4-benzoquinol methylase
MRAGHHLWFRRVVPLVGARLAHDAEAYQYLPRSTAYLPPPDDLLALVEAAGFTSVERRTFTAGAVQLVTGTRR